MFNSCWSIWDDCSEPPLHGIRVHRGSRPRTGISIFSIVSFYLFWGSINLSVSFWSHKVVCCNSEYIHVLEWGNSRLVYTWSETATARCDRGRGVLLLVGHPRFPARCGSAKFPMGREKYTCVRLYIKGEKRYRYWYEGSSMLFKEITHWL